MDEHVGRNRSNTVEFLSGAIDQYSDAYNKLADSYKEKEAEVITLAQIGKNLLEQNKKAEEEIEELKRREVTKDEVILQLQEALKHEEQRANSLTASIDSKSSSFVAAYEAQLDRLHSDNSKLREDYLHLQEQHQSVLDTYVKKEKLLSRDVTELRERLTEITNELENCKHQLEVSTKKEQSQKETLRQFEIKRQEDQDIILKLEERIKLTDSKLKEETTKNLHKDSETFQLRGELKEQLTAVKQSEASLQETISILVTKNHTLYNENTELQQYVDESKEMLRIAQGRKRADSGSLLPPFPIPAADQQQPLKVQSIPPSSLLSELEASLNEKIKSEIHGNGEQQQQHGTEEMPTKHRDRARTMVSDNFSESEFFFLTAAAVKIGLIMKFSNKAAVLVQADVKQLYQKAVNEHIPFHDWHAWVTSQYGNLLFGEDSPVSMDSNNAVAKSTTTPDHNNNTSEPTETKVTAEAKVHREEVENQSTKHPVESISPHPEQNILLHKLFKLPDSEFLVDYYTCELDSTLKGTMFVTYEAVYFYASRGADAKEVKMVLRYADITSIVIKKGFFSKNQLVFTIRQADKVEISYRFISFVAIDFVYEVVFKMWKHFTTVEEKLAQNRPKYNPEELRARRNKNRTWAT